MNAPRKPLHADKAAAPVASNPASPLEDFLAHDPDASAAKDAAAIQAMRSEIGALLPGAGPDPAESKSSAGAGAPPTWLTEWQQCTESDNLYADIHTDLHRMVAREPGAVELIRKARNAHKASMAHADAAIRETFALSQENEVLRAEIARLNAANGSEAARPERQPDVGALVSSLARVLVDRAAAKLRATWPTTQVQFSYWLSGTDFGFIGKLEWHENRAMHIRVFDERTGDELCSSLCSDLFEAAPGDCNFTPADDELERERWRQANRKGQRA